VQWFQHAQPIATADGGGLSAVYKQTLWTWMNVAGFAPQFTLQLDGLSLTMLGVVTGVGLLIHLFASWYMRGEEGYERFFAYMNLFVASMLFLVLADNLLFLYFGWEGVGLCSYLLIGFYYKVPANGYAARKAFVVTRVGDTSMAIGLFLLYRDFGTLDIHDLLARAPQVWTVGSHSATLATLLLLGGAVGKSAQLPLQTWLPDAMAGPTPVSALIHAATMVTAGVYLIARMHTLFEMAPVSEHWVGIVGAATLLIAGFCALVQTDIKRILAYSTMSQIGYMFLALGAGAWQAAIFHLMTHAFFKALLFLTAGAVIIATHHEQDIFKMGGLRKTLKLEYACFWVGGAALAALPIVTAGFYSKDEILWNEMASHHPGFLMAGVLGAFLTSIYTFRLIFVVFHGEEKIHAHPGHGVSYALPLVVLLILSTLVGAFIHQPLAGVLPANPGAGTGTEKEHLALLSGVVALAGVAVAAWLYLGERKLVKAVAASAPGRFLTALWLNAFGFDLLYDLLFVKPYLAIVNFNRRDGFDAVVGFIPRLMKLGHDMLSVTENGRLRWYAATVAGGVVLLLATLALV
jgi:NADH-quinone oxidoreductase subunit L